MGDPKKKDDPAAELELGLDTKDPVTPEKDPEEGPEAKDAAPSPELLEAQQKIIDLEQQISDEADAKAKAALASEDAGDPTPDVAPEQFMGEFERQAVHARLTKRVQSVLIGYVAEGIRPTVARMAKLQREHPALFAGYTAHMTPQQVKEAVGKAKPKKSKKK